MDVGDLLDLDITDVAHNGVFVARHASVTSATTSTDRVVFVPDAIPGERVRVRLTDLSHAAYWRAEAVEVLDAAPERRPHVWHAADIHHAPESRPGGADFGHIALEHQRRLKLRVIRDALARIGGIADLPVTIAAPAPDGHDDVETPDGTGWRTRLSLHVDDHGTVGPFAARSHRVIPVDDHPLATPGVEQAARKLTGGRPGRIDLTQPADGRVRVIPRPRARRVDQRPRRTHDRTREVVVERVGDREFRVDAGGFWQVHRLAATSLHRLVAEKLRGRIDPEAHHLDLYGGVGLFAAALADAGATRITTVESDRRATAHARDNLSDVPDLRAETGRVDRWLETEQAEASSGRRAQLSRGVVVLDPPRSGAGRNVVESLVDLAPAAVVYVACDPVALARDLATFRGGGYETTGVDAVDLFPNSHHVEAVAVLTRDSRPR